MRRTLDSKRPLSVARNAVRALGSAVSSYAPLGPKGVNLPLANVCNSNCTFCPWFADDSRYVSIGKGRAKVPADTSASRAEALRPRFLELPLIERLAADLRDMRVEEVTISGFGEALMHPDIEAICELLGRHHLVVVITNGIGLRAKKLDRLLAHDVVLRVSLHAATATTWKAIHPMNHARNFDEICDAIRHIQGSYGDRVALHNVICRDNVDEIEAIYALGRELGVRQVSFFPVLTHEMKTPAQHEPTPEERETAIRGLERVASRARADGADTNAAELVRLWRDGPRWDPEPLYREIDCRIGYVMALLTPDGKVKPCCQCDPVASWSDTSFKEAWNSEGYRRFREAGRRIGEDGSPAGCHCDRCEDIAPNVRLHRLLHPLSLLRGR